MRGKAVFYPMGWDDNGLPTERRVQNYYGVRCDPSLPYDPAFEPPEKPGKQAISVSRPNFIELCERLTVEDEKAFEALWRQLGLSVDWSMTYATISRASQRVSQLAFLNLLRKDRAYQLEAPTLWDVDFRTAVAQAELEDREQPGAYHKLRFARADGGRRSRSRRRGPSCCRPASRWSRIPTTSATKPLFGSEVRDAALRRAGADPRASAGQPRQGHRRRDDLHVRRSHRRHLVARAEPAGARRSSRPNGTLRADRRGAAPGWESRDAARGAGRLRPAGRRSSVDQGAHEDRRAAAASRAICSASRGRSRTRSSSTRRAIGRSRSSPAGSGSSARCRSASAARARPRAAVAPAVHAGALRELGRRPERRLVRQPPALLRRAVPGLVPPRRRRPARLRARRCCPTTRSCRSIRRPTCRPASPRRSAASRTASSAIPTSWTRGRRRR